MLSAVVVDCIDSSKTACYHVPLEALGGIVTRSVGLFFVVPFLLCNMRIAQQSANVASNQPVRTVPLTRTLHIPLIKSATSGSGGGSVSASPSLGFSAGGVDELPEGPAGFDVLDDGRLLITDPLRLRVSLFDANGLYQQSWPIGFAADSISAEPEGSLLIRDAKTGKVYSFDREGKQRAGVTEEIPPSNSAKLTNSKNGVVDRPCGQPLAIRLDVPDVSLLSLEDLSTNPSCVTFVALETSARGASPEAIDMRKSVRRYSGDGRLVSETSDLPLDYYIIPVNELRVHHDMVYQLRTTRTEVSINEWDMSESALLSKP